MGKWLNADGLYVKLGTDEGARTTGGMYATPSAGGMSVVEYDIDLTQLTSTAGGYIPADNVLIPANSYIQAVEIDVLTAATSGGSATFDAGLCKVRSSLSGTAGTGAAPTDEIDFDGLLSLITVASLAAKTNFRITGNQESPSIGGTVGALVGTTIGASPGHLCLNYTTAAFTAGRIIIRVIYRPNYAVVSNSNTTADPAGSNSTGFDPT